MCFDARFVSTVAQALRVSEAQIKPEAVPAQDLGVDSLNMVSLTIVLEDTYHVELPCDIDAHTTLGQLSATVDQLLGLQAA
jgi:acyl carrier protein